MRPRYAEGFVLECAALVREEMGIRNVKVMIPFYRTVDEATRVIAVIAEHGLQQGHAGLEAWAMCEVPSNALLADEFLDPARPHAIGKRAPGLHQRIPNRDSTHSAPSGVSPSKMGTAMQEQMPLSRMYPSGPGRWMNRSSTR